MGKEAKKKPAKSKAKTADEAKPAVKKAAAGKPAAKAAAKPGAAKRALPMPPTIPAGAQPRKAALQAESRHLAPLDRPTSGDIEVLRRLWDTVEARRLSGDTTLSHSARLMARGTAKVAQKLGEEAVECVIEATQGNRAATILESADLLYHLIVVWVDAGIRPEEVWGELVRREGLSGIVEKANRPKGILRAAETTKLP